MKFYWEVYYVAEIDEQLLLLVGRDDDSCVCCAADYTPNSGHFTDLSSYHKTLVYYWEA